MGNPTPITTDLARLEIGRAETALPRSQPTLDVAVVGLGYVGLVTSACLAALGHTVRGVEADPAG